MGVRLQMARALDKVGGKTGLAITTLCIIVAFQFLESRNHNSEVAQLRAVTTELATAQLKAQMQLEQLEKVAADQQQPSKQRASQPEQADNLPGVVSKTSSTDMLRPLGGPNGLADRMSRLEAITKGRLNWIREPYVGHRVMHKCAHEEHLDEHYICYDHFPPPSERAEPCIIYDMGIREQPGFGKTLADKYPQCQVHAFDPSPIAVAFQASDDETAKALRALPNYHFHPYGSGGVDGHVKLYDYNWGQVSSIRVPHFVTNDCGYGEEQNLADPNIQKDLTLKYHQRRCRTNDNMNESEEKMQKVQGEATRGGFGETSFLLEVKTLKTIMKELGHTHIDVLKLDVEGSEFAFLESALDDFDCPPVEQMSIEWHHYNFDSRYGGGASPEVNAIATYLHDRCNVKQYQITMDNGGWEDNFEWLKDAYLQLRFNTGSYMRAR